MPDHFHFEWGGEATLSVSQIWPDGDAPNNPTTEDVFEQMRKSRSLYSLCQEWGFDIEGVDVNGRDCGLR